ncbi:GroES protein [Salix suchowensis]|nr:GroES protein [Salix suchowensis]
MGHEFIGEIITLGESFRSDAVGRPASIRLYRWATRLCRHSQPIVVNASECHCPYRETLMQMCIVSICRLGYTGRCTTGLLFGCDALDGGQAQYVRVPKAGSTLFSLSKPTWNSTLSGSERAKALAGLNDSSLLLLADILPTGVFAAIQATSHPKVLPMINGLPWPYALNPDQASDLEMQVLTPEDRLLVFAIKAASLQNRRYRPLEARREKMKAVYDKIGSDGKGQGEFAVASIDEAKALVQTLTGGVGCTAVLEIVGNNSAISLAYDLVRAFGAIVSVGVHGEPSVPFTGRQLYNKNVSFDFGRCPARAMFPPAFDLLGEVAIYICNTQHSPSFTVKRQDVFGGVGEPTSLIDRIISLDDAPEAYKQFDKGEWGKVILDPWKQ